MDLSLINNMRTQLELTTSGFKRYMYYKVSWDARMFGLVGPRGIGKTTMVLQYVKEHQNDRKILYVSADHVYFSTHTLVGLADEFAREGGEQLFIDEIHKYENWSRELKQIYDSHPDIKVVFTGSSVIYIEVMPI